MTVPFAVEVCSPYRAARLVLVGELDHAAVAELETTVRSVGAVHGLSNVVVDVRALEFCDSAGWHALERCRADAATLFGFPPCLRRLFYLIGTPTSSDEGTPIVQCMPESLSARAFLRVAENLAAQVSTLTMGGVSSDRPEIAETTQPSETEVRILWKDGHESIYTGYALRVGCRCAVCVDEISGSKRLREESISKDVRPLSMDPVGRYAIRFQWSDGHSTGIYTFEHLRELCPCPICADNAKARGR